MKVSSFKRQLILCMLFVGFSAIVVLSGVSLFTSETVSRNNLLHSMELIDRQTCSEIDTRMAQIENIREYINFNIFQLYMTPQTPKDRYIEKFKTTRNTMGALESSFSTYNVGVFLPSDSIVSTQGVEFFPLERLEEYGMTEEELLGNKTQPIWKLNKSQTFVWTFKGIAGANDVLSCWGYYSNWIQEELYYAYVVHLDCGELNRLLYQSHPDEGLKSYLVKKDGLVISDKETGLVGGSIAFSEFDAMLSSGEKERQEHDSTFLLNRVGDRDFYLFTEIPENYIIEKTPPIAPALFITILSTLMIVLFTTILFSHHITHRITILSDVIRNLKPSQNTAALAPLNVMVEKREERKDEIDMLAATLKQIVTTNDRNVEELLAMSLQEEHLKYQLLQAKINPHFLYNILDSIKGCLVTEKIETAKQMTGYLGKFYREILHTSETLVPISEELRIAELYLQLEKLCRNDVFRWEIEMDDGIGEFLIPKFILQPILENCVLHGQKSSLEQLKIKISLTYGEDQILICISDNGAGIGSEKLQDIRRILESHTVLEKKYYGISNVNRRLASYFSTVSHIEIDSAVGRGTAISIHLQQMIEGF